MLFLRLAYRNVKKNWRHSFAAVISISAAFLSLVVFQGYMEDVRRMYLETFRSRMMYGDLIVEDPALRQPEGRAEPWKHYITREQQNEMAVFFDKRAELIDSSVRFLLIDGVVTNGRTTTVFRGSGYDIDAGAAMRAEEWAWNTMYGSPHQIGDNRNGALLGQSLGHILECAPVEKMKITNSTHGYTAENRPFNCLSNEIQLNVATSTGILNALSVPVVGLVDAAYRDIDNKFVWLSLQNAQSLFNTDGISYLTVKLKDPKNAYQMIAEFNETMKAKGIPAVMNRWIDHTVGEMYIKTMDLLSVFRNFVVIVILSIAGLSVFNTMVKIVKERTREIGTLRSIGFEPMQVAWIFFFESALLSALGCAIGAVGSIVSSIVLNHAGIVYKAGILVEPVPFRILFKPELYLISLGLLVVLSVITTYFVCRSILKRNVSDNLSFA